MHIYQEQHIVHALCVCVCVCVYKPKPKASKKKNQIYILTDYVTYRNDRTFIASVA